MDEHNLPPSLLNKKNINHKKMEYEYNCKNLESYKADFINNLNKEKDELTLALSKLEQELQKLDSQYEFLNIKVRKGLLQR